MKALLLFAVLSCACCGAQPAQGQENEVTLRPATVNEQAAPAEQQQEGWVVMTELDYQRLMHMLQLLTNALEQRNEEMSRLSAKLKETCP